MTGTVQVSKNKLFVVINYVDANGQRKQKWISTGLDPKGNKRKAEKLKDEILAEYEKKKDNVQTDILFTDYIRKWLEWKKDRIDIITYQGYIFAVNAVIPYFEKRDMKLVDINRRNLQVIFDDMNINGRTRSEKPLKANTIKRYKNVVNQALKHAVMEDLIPSNPCQYVELPKVEKYNSTFYTIQQIKDLFAAIKGDVLENLIKITVLYGLRRSEVLGIKWDSIDFESGKLEIKHTVVTMNSTVEKDKTKNSSSHRTFPLTPDAIAIFEEEKRKEEANRILFGDDYIESDYVFKWDSGKPFSTDYVTKHFSDLLEQNNLPHIRFHELRHSCASMLMNTGYTLKDVQEYMGHANIKMTADIYGHLDSSRKSELSKGIAGNIFED